MLYKNLSLQYFAIWHLNNKCIKISKKACLFLNVSAIFANTEIINLREIKQLITEFIYCITFYNIFLCPPSKKI